MESLIDPKSLVSRRLRPNKHATDTTHTEQEEWRGPIALDSGFVDDGERWVEVAEVEMEAGVQECHRRYHNAVLLAVASLTSNVSRISGI